FSNALCSLRSPRSVIVSGPGSLDAADVDNSLRSAAAIRCVSKLHSPAEFVGVARPKTGPWPSASERRKTKTTEQQKQMLHDFLRAGRHMDAHPRDFIGANRRRLDS